MNKIIKINGRPLLNFMDLKSETLQPLELYEQISAFAEFSKTHCVLYPLVLKNKGDEQYTAEYLTKDFWQSVLDSPDIQNMKGTATEVMKKLFEKEYSNVLFDENFEDYTIKLWESESKEKKSKSAEKRGSTANSKNIKSDEIEEIDPLNDKYVRAAAEAATTAEIKSLLSLALTKGTEALPDDLSEDIKKTLFAKYQEAYKKGANKTRKKEKVVSSVPRVFLALKDISTEYSDAEINKKIEFIEKNGNCKENARKTVLLLAICELSECDARKANWKKTVSTVPEVKKVPQKQKNKNKQVSAKPESTVVASPFPYENSISLDCSNITYRFLCYDSNYLEKGKTIRTVKIIANKSSNYKTSVIELFSQKEKTCIQRIALQSGEYVYVNATGDKIIKALPDIFASQDTFIVKKQNALKIYHTTKDAWMPDTSAFNNITCVATGSDSEGFLILNDGKVITYNCRMIESNYTASLGVKSIISPVAEIAKVDVGFAILLNDGTVFYTHKRGTEKGVAFLNSRTVNASEFENTAKRFNNTEIENTVKAEKAKFPK